MPQTCPPAFSPFREAGFYQLVMEATEITFFDYRPTTDTLYLSLSVPDGGRVLKTVRCFRRCLMQNPAVPPEQRETLCAMVGRYCGQAETGSVSLCLNLTGSFLWYAAFARSLPLSGPVQRVVGYLRDVQAERVSELRFQRLMHSHRALEERAATDGVTGLLNRATLEERAENALHCERQPCYFILFDVDNFKTVNDTCGHAEGDRVLREIAAVMRSHTRKTDLLGRIGGDEFAALLTGFPTPEAAFLRIQAMINAVGQIKSPAGWQGCFSVSAGMAASGPCRAGYDSLYRAADRALYRAKALGKNQCCVEE